MNYLTLFWKSELINRVMSTCYVLWILAAKEKQGLRHLPQTLLDLD